MGCATTDIPEVTVYREVPFLDGAEGVYIKTLSKETGLLSASEWAKKKPYMIMIDPEGWIAIKGQWYEACRIAGPKCNVTVDSVDVLIKRLDKIARAAFGPLP